MRHRRYLALAVAAALWPAASLAECRDDVLDLRGEWGSARFTVEVADDFEEQRRGLMFREIMPMFAGMIFVYPRAQSVSFWMRNTLIPLDMIFIGSDGVVRNIHENAIPLDETPIFGGADIQYVLEINGGLSARLGIDVGTEVRHPSIDASVAAWACVIG